MLNPSRRVLVETCGPYYYPFGNTRSRNVFEDVGYKIGSEENNMTKVIFKELFLKFTALKCMTSSNLFVYMMLYKLGSLFGMWGS